MLFCRQVTSALAKSSKHIYHFSRRFATSPNTEITKAFGALAQLPKVPSPDELVAVGTTRANRLLHDKYISGEKSKSLDHALRKLEVFAEYALYRIKKCLHAAPLNASQLHPFERTVVGLSLGPETLDPKTRFVLDPKSHGTSDALAQHVESGLKEYRETLRGLQKIQSSIEALQQERTAVLKKCQTRKEVAEVDLETYVRLKTLLTSETTGSALMRVDSMFTLLRRLNVMNPSLPTVVLVGCPNVGKSTLVSLLSTAAPETQNYPFTTRSVLVGHLTLDDYVVQVADTPGLLNRRDAERKKLEMLTLSVLEHIPDLIVLFVIDPTGYCGTSLSDQLAVRSELRYRYGRIVPANRWFDVVSKTDIWKQDGRFRGIERLGKAAELNIRTPMTLESPNSLDDGLITSQRWSGKQRIKKTSTTTPSHPCEDTVPATWSLDGELANQKESFPVTNPNEDCYYFEIASLNDHEVLQQNETTAVEPGTPVWALKQGQAGLSELRNALGWELMQMIQQRQKQAKGVY